MGRVTVTDQMGRQISIPWPLKRIVSLVPSQTELLYDLGLREEVVGVTKFCIYPEEEVKLSKKIGGTKKLNIDLIRDLKPDLIIGNKEENDREQIEQLMAEFPVWMSDIENLKDALQMIAAVGKLVGKAEKADAMVGEINRQFKNLSLVNGAEESRRVAYFIWKDPYMVAGQGTFISDLLRRAGWINAVSISRYPAVERGALQELDPDWIFLSSEPYPFKDNHIDEFKQICPRAKVVIVDGEMFSWYGSRLLLASNYLQTLSADRG